MTSTFQSGQVSIERSLAMLLADATGGGSEQLSVTVLGRKVILQGLAPTYAFKARANETLRLAGFTEVDNRLRVAPGVPPPTF